jgi:hypothetical protein
VIALSSNRIRRWTEDDWAERHAIEMAGIDRIDRGLVEQLAEQRAY